MDGVGILENIYRVIKNFKKMNVENLYIVGGITVIILRFFSEIPTKYRVVIDKITEIASYLIGCSCIMVGVLGIVSIIWMLYYKLSSDKNAYNFIKD